MAAVDAVIVGGGCVGASVAYHLAEAGYADIVLLEADTLASGSTSKAAGGIRLQHGDALNVRLAQRSLAELMDFEQLTGAEISFRQVGYLFLLSSPSDLAMFGQSVALQQSLGVPVRTLSPEQAGELVPQLRTEDLLGATFCPSDGYATPEAVVQGYAAAARRRGVVIRQGERVRRIVTEHGRVQAVETERGERIATSTVICTAGTGSRAIAATAEVDLPVSPERRRLFFTSHSGGIADDVPLTIDFATGFYFHREGPGLVFGGREVTAEDLMTPATHRLPVIVDAPLTSTWHGDYDMSPDHNAMVGRSAHLEGFYYATGFSGHGFQLSPAVGEHLAELVTGRQPSIDLTPFRVERFAEVGGSRVEPIVV
ncbi:MAG TPA: FAD-binding oxidoreductase [Jatrophihabitans sp.]|jgi:sarcosine oxidase subunit beta|uniref:NAD(P)/FAD-dependent oxidoreductase n=1 Tax=Jatrophihabitans sp. TaxID=1932789 RepID=UPI002F0A7FFC